MLINLFFIIGGDFANTGWLAITPLSELEFNPSVGVDYLIWSLQLSGLGSLAGRDQFFCDDHQKSGRPGMTLMKMPLFVWTSLMRHGPDYLRISSADSDDAASLA